MNTAPKSMGTIQREAREALENANKHGGHEPGDELNETTTNVNKTPETKNENPEKREKSAEPAKRAVVDGDFTDSDQPRDGNNPAGAKGVEFTNSTLKNASNVVDDVQNASESAVKMIKFTIDLTKKEKLDDDADNDKLEDGEDGTDNVSKDDCACVCHPGKCSCKADSVAVVKQEFPQFEDERICKCLMRRIQREKELYGTSLSPIEEEVKEKPCIDSCLCHCHKNDIKKIDDSDKCIGTCTVHCPGHRSSNSSDSSHPSVVVIPEIEPYGGKPAPKSLAAKPAPKFAGKPSGDEKESEQIWSNQKYDEENPTNPAPAVAEGKKVVGPTTNPPSEDRRPSGNLFRRISQSIRRSK